MKPVGMNIPSALGWYRPGVGVPRDVGCRALVVNTLNSELVVYAANLFSVQFPGRRRGRGRAPCTLRLQVLKGSSSGGHKFKVRGLRASRNSLSTNYRMKTVQHAFMYEYCSSLGVAYRAIPAGKGACSPHSGRGETSR